MPRCFESKLNITREKIRYVLHITVGAASTKWTQVTPSFQGLLLRESEYNQVDGAVLNTLTLIKHIVSEYQRKLCKNKDRGYWASRQ